MAFFDTAYDFMMGNEDPARACAEVPDAPAGSHAISGINSHAYPQQFAAIAALPQDQREAAVKAFYQSEFWSAYLGSLISDDLAARVLDEAVNAGPGTAVKLLQQAINDLGGIRIPVDGAWGPITVAAANNQNQTMLLNAFRQARIAHYQAIAAANPELSQYLPEWIARAEK